MVSRLTQMLKDVKRFKPPDGACLSPAGEYNLRCRLKIGWGNLRLLRRAKARTLLCIGCRSVAVANSQQYYTRTTIGFARSGSCSAPWTSSRCAQSQAWKSSDALIFRFLGNCANLKVGLCVRYYTIELVNQDRHLFWWRMLLPWTARATHFFFVVEPVGLS